MAKKPRKPRRYYTLLQRVDDHWSPQFGDYDLETVKSERDDYRDHDVRARDLKIVETPDASWAAIEAILNKLNGRG
nr:hypothetical protein [Neorhizobium tomejilense]